MFPTMVILMCFGQISSTIANLIKFLWLSSVH
jgi:hypothetical protein